MGRPNPPARDRLRGVVPVLEVPFTADGALDLDGFDRVVTHVAGTGVSAVMFPGFASEFHKLSDYERETLTYRLLDRSADFPDLDVVVSVPDHATRLAVTRSVAAVRAGAGAINLLPPHFLGPSAEQVHRHVTAVLEAVAPTPVILQYAPAQTGSSFSPDGLRALAAAHPNLAAVKIETPLPGRLAESLAAGTPALRSFIGYAGLQLADALRRGVAGVQPGCSFTEIYQRTWHLWHSGEQEAALALHHRLVPYLAYWMQEVELIIAVEKLISVRRGIIDHPHCRYPARLLDPAETAMVDRFLTEFGDILNPTLNGETP
ncbi:dihydrodipicolinate synthase family protein (plasmid) [Streptomyces sp. NBC_00841]|uniref:dihydrodipicolinate synthase family protein n=1 Tax=unclassified Streptomyces TaxID=2593676 RepID=UPI0022508DEC|nr:MULTISPECIES: dihydrodipicolinate synthase family protein [unclassified Streptomyces]MCX4538824.1 dihydrodipicolinate synthase family protein [Streptomyces sp. NBC_01669]WSA05381.1 dihydrodipicolinate synthase family protein [Streptomyces sp. NBC_00841]